MSSVGPAVPFENPAGTDSGFKKAGDRRGISTSGKFWATISLSRVVGAQFSPYWSPGRGEPDCAAARDMLDKQAQAHEIGLRAVENIMAVDGLSLVRSTNRGLV